MKISKTLIISALAVLLLSLLFGIGISVIANTRPSVSVLFKNCQNETVSYDNAENSKYCLYILKRSGIVHKNFEIAVSRDFEDSVPDYGHVVAYPYVDTELMNADNPSFSAANVSWRNEGVYFETRTKHSVFIPKEMIVGGR